MSWLFSFFCVSRAHLVAPALVPREDLFEGAVEELGEAVDLDFGELPRGVDDEVVFEAAERGVRLAGGAVGEDEGVSEGGELGEDLALVAAFAVDEQEDRPELLAPARQDLALFAPRDLRVPDPLLHLHLRQLLEDLVLLQRPPRAVVVDHRLDLGPEDVLQRLAPERQAAADALGPHRERALAARVERSLAERVALVELADDFAVLDALDGALGEPGAPL